MDERTRELLVPLPQALSLRSARESRTVWPEFGGQAGNSRNARLANQLPEGRLNRGLFLFQTRNIPLLFFLVLPFHLASLASPKSLQMEELLAAGVQFERGDQVFQALDVYRQVLEREPDHERAVLRLTRLLYRIGRTEEAFDTARAALQAAPRHVRLRLDLAYLLQIQAHLDEAAIHIDQALEALRGKASPNDPILVYGLHLLGRNLLGQGQIKEGEKQLLKVLEMRPDHLEAHLNLGQLYGRQPENYENGVRHLRTALELQPDLFIAHRELGKILLNLGRPAEAVDSFQKLIQLEPDSAEAHYLLAAAFRAQGRINQAREALSRFEHLKSQDPIGTGLQLRARALSLEGEEHLARNELNAALRAFQRAVDAYPDPSAFYGISRIYEQLGMPGQGLEAIVGALALDPSNPEYLYLAAACLKQLNDLPNALQAVQHAILVNPFPAEYHNLLGNLLVATEEFERAAAAYAKAIELEPANSFYHLNLSSVLALTGDLKGSEREKALYLKLLARSPD